jgi:hypothetical protein
MAAAATCTTADNTHSGGDTHSPQQQQPVSLQDFGMFSFSFFHFHFFTNFFLSIT